MFCKFLPGISFVWISLALLGPAIGAAQDLGIPVRYTAAREHTVRQTVRLTGSVEARRTAVVATEVAGVVAALVASEGEEVGKGSALVRLRREPIELRQQAAAGELAEAVARLKSAELRLERARELEVSEVVSRQRVDDTAYEAEALQGRVAQLRAETARLDRDLANTTVRASFTGVIGKEHAQVGEWLDIGDPVVELISLDALEVRLQVPERYFHGLSLGTSSTLRFLALPGFELMGKVKAIVPRADPQARTFPVLVGLPNSARRIAVGMLAEVDLAIGAAATAIVVPKDAVVTQDSESTVFVLKGESAVRRVAVEVGAGVGQWIAVTGEIAAGDSVVVRGNEALSDGQAVNGQPRSYPQPDSPMQETGDP